MKCFNLVSVLILLDGLERLESKRTEKHRDVHE